MGFAAPALQFIAGIGVSGAAATAASAALRFAIFTAASTLLAKKFAPGGPGIGNRTVTNKGTIEPQAIIYGEALVAAGTLAYRKAQGPNNSQLWSVHCLAGHEVTSITDIWLDDKVISNSVINGGAAGGGAVSSGTYAPTRSVNTVEVWKHLGTSTQTYDTNLATADTDGEWTSAHRLRGIAYIVTMFKLNDRTEVTWEAGDPTNVKALVRGKKVYDPRLDSTQSGGSGSHRVATPSTWEWSDNPALCVADYLMDAKFSPLEGGIDPSRIDWAAVMSAADDCDTLVFIPPAASPQNTEKRFTCNGVLSGTASGEQNLEALLSSMNGTLVFSGGQYIIHAGVYEAPADTLSEDDIIGPIGIKTSLSSDERVNSMKAVFIDPNKKYEPTETVLISPSAYKDTRDGGAELVQSIDLPMTNSWYMAQRIVLKRLYEANEELTLTVPCNLRAARLVPGERVSLTITERSWIPKIFKVIDWDFFDRGGNEIGVKVTLREDSSGAYADPQVSDYNTLTNGVLTIADPEIYPSRETLPRGMRWGEGVWSIRLTKNQLTAGTANDGEIRVQSGVYVLHDGSVRAITANTQISTPFESGTLPPDGRFFIVWGASNPNTRFGLTSPGVFGDVGAAAAGLFPAIYDRFSGQWYAVDNAGNEGSFTPADTDYVVAVGHKDNTTVGITSLTTIVAYGEVTQSNLTPLSGVAIRNPHFTEPFPGNVSRPSAWFEVNNTTLRAGYLSGATNVMTIPEDSVIGSTAWRIDPNVPVRITVVAKAAATMTSALDIRVEELDSELDIAGDEYTIGAGGANAEFAAVRTRVQTVLANQTLTTSYQSFSANYYPTSTAIWAALSLYGSSVTGTMHIRSVTLEPLAPVTARATPPIIIWDTYEAGGWSPSDTTRSITVEFLRSGTVIATRSVDATLTDSGANEGDIAVVGGSSSGDSTTVTVSNNNTPAVSVEVEHDNSGVSIYVTFGSNIPGYSGSSISK